jgi:hypothetical protein
LPLQSAEGLKDAEVWLPDFRARRRFGRKTTGRIPRRPGAVLLDDADIFGQRETSTHQDQERQEMKSVMVRYKVKPDRADENEGYIKRVFEQLKRERPSGLRYASFKLGDGVSFVHIASLDAGDGSNPLGALPAFKVFAADIKERCDEPPVVATLNEVGAYNMFSDIEG